MCYRVFMAVAKHFNLVRLGKVQAFLATCSAMGLALIFLRDAEACTYAPEEPWSVDPALAEIDTQAPPAPVVRRAEVRRGKGSVCEPDGSCLVSSCGDWGNVFVELETEQASAEPLGYRLHLVEGSVPPGFARVLERTNDGRSSLLWRGSFDEVLALNATFELVAIDRAGNESEASLPFDIAFDGCTRGPLAQEECLEDQLPTGTVISAEQPVMLGFEQEGGCNVAAGRNTRKAWFMGLLLAGIGVLGVGRRARADKR